MAECIVPCCRSTNCELFCAPDDKNKLKKWQMTIGTKKSEFLICEKHFQNEFIITEKSLTSNAFPSLFLNQQDYQKESACQSCLKQLSPSSDRKLTTEKFVDIIFKKLGFEIKKNTSLCKVCFDTFRNVQNILSIQELKKNNPPAIKIETIDIDNEEEESHPIQQLPPLKVLPKPNDNLPKAKIVVFPSKAQSTPKEIKEVPQVVTTQANPINVVQRNFQSPELTSVQRVIPKMVPITGPLAIVKGNNTHEYVIPLKDSTPQEKPNIATMRRKSAAPMTIIHNSSSDKIMSDEVTSLKNDVTNSKDFAAAAKRRASVGNPSTVSSEIKAPQHSSIIRVLPSMEFRCSECKEPFATSRLLKYHEDNGLCDRKAQATSTSRALNSFKCADCENSFQSYYFLRRHRETCTLSLRVKCTYQYCRFRGTNPGEIQKHFQEVHAHKLKCKECEEAFKSQAALTAHEIARHGKEDLAKKRAMKQRQARAAKRAKADLDFDSNTLIECEQCKIQIHPRDLASHMTVCKRK